MARTPSTTQPADPEPQLTVSVAEARSRIERQVLSGLALSPKSASIQLDDLDAWFAELWNWHDFNKTLLKKLLGPAILDHYRDMMTFGGSRDPRVRLSELDREWDFYMRHLVSVRDRLELWSADDDDSHVSDSRPPSEDAPIFVVHGRELPRAEQVARVVERTTGRDAIILHEQPNSGRTVLEKFEHHAQNTAFAVVVITADDVGSAKGVLETTPRGRQNVIFELGFFFGYLGRGRVAVLMEPGIEQPSDVAGLVYIALDSAGTWRTALMKELQSAGIGVDMTRMP